MTESPKKDPRKPPKDASPSSVKKPGKKQLHPKMIEHSKMGLGRPKGALNKTTATVKQAIVDAFHLAGGVDYLVKLAGKDPRAFATLLAKILPTDVKVDGDIRHSALFSPEQLRRMADAQEQGTIDITESATITYPVGGQGQSEEETRRVWPGPADRHFPDGEGGCVLDGGPELGSHPSRHSDD